MEGNKKSLYGRYILEEEGISTIVIEIVLAVIIIGLLLNWIAVRDRSTDLIISQVNSSSREDKLYLSASLELIDHGDFYGADVVSDIRYFADDGNVSILVNNSKGSYVYTNESYDESLFRIDYQEIYECQIQEGGGIMRTYTLK